MTSLEFFHYPEATSKAPIHWGTTEPRHIKVDSTLYQSPTYLIKEQPIPQFYRVSPLNLSNVRAHDQVEPRSLELDMNKYQNSHPFPMQHPLTSQISNAAVFPTYLAPEDPKRGETGLRSTTKTLSVEAATHPDPSIVVSKNSGAPYRHEVHYLPIPSQREGAWWVDKEMYQNPKPDRVQSYYPAPVTILAPNPKLRTFSASLDAKHWNILRNKERDLLQTTHQIDYYKDGLGTRAPLDTDNLDEKNLKEEKTGKVDNTMKPYFKRGYGLASRSIATFEHSSDRSPSRPPSSERPIQLGPYTRLEVDEYEMQTGRDYKNYPESKFSNVPTMAIIQNPNPPVRAKTATPTVNEGYAKNRLQTEEEEREKNHYFKIQNMEMENRQKNLELITPDRDIRLLRIKNKELENTRGAKPMLKQNTNDHVNTLYENEYKYLGERSELYKTSYNPYLLNQYIAFQKPNRDSLTINGYLNKKDVAIPDDQHEHRPKLMAEKVFDDHHNGKRAPLEQGLLEPNLLAQPKIQENGFTLKQTSYGDSHNTKKFLQENALETYRLTDPVYRPLNPAELQYQNIVLRSKADKVALEDYKLGLTNDPNDYIRASEIVEQVDRQNKEQKRNDYPRLSGPIPPQPYERIYCNEEITEMSDGFKKRFESRVYDSPFVKEGDKYAPLNSDIKTLNEIEQKERERAAANEAAEANANKSSETAREYSMKDRKEDIVARKVKDPLREQANITVHQKDYNRFYYTQKEQCPGNNYYEPIEYSQKEFKYENPHQSRLVSLQDRWTKTQAQKKFLSQYPTPTADLRENITLGKKPVSISQITCSNVAAKMPIK